MDVCVNTDVHDKSLVYSGAEKSDQLSTRRSNIKGEEMCEVRIKSPSRWGYAIAMESENTNRNSEELIANKKELRAKYEQMKVNYMYERISTQYKQIPVKDEHIDAKCKQTQVKDDHVFTKQKQTLLVKCNTLNGNMFPKSITDLADEESSDAMQVNEMKFRMSRGMRASLSNCYIRKKREREPSRIPYRKFLKLFRKGRRVRNAAKLYLKRCIPSSSKLKLVLSKCFRSFVAEKLAQSKHLSTTRKYHVRQDIHCFFVRVRTLKHKKVPLLCVFFDETIFMKLEHCQVQTYNVSDRVLSLSGDIEKNPGPSYECSRNSNLASVGTSPENSILLLETRLSDLNRTAVDVGGGGDCFFRAISHQLYGNPNNHLYVRRLGVQYLVQKPEHFIESNTERSWQGYLENMSLQGTWADAIIVQAVANCLNLSIHIVESNENFAPVTVVQPSTLTTGCRNIYIGHIAETHYVSTDVKRSSNSDFQSKLKCGQTVVTNKFIDKNEKQRAYMKQYMKKRRADAEFRKNENTYSQQRYNNVETIKENKKKAFAKRRMTNLELAREIEKQSFRKRKAENAEHIREVDKCSKRKQREVNPEHVREIGKRSFKKRKVENPELVREINKSSKRKRTEMNPEHYREIEKRSFKKRKVENPELVRETNKSSKLKQREMNPEHDREIKNRSFKKRKVENPELVREINKSSKRKLREMNPEHDREIQNRSFKKRKVENPELVREINKSAKRKRTEMNPEHYREIEKRSFKKRKAQNPGHIRQINRNAKARKTQICHEVQLDKQNFTDMINLFHNKIRCGPEYVCTCCDQLWYRSSVVKCDASKYKGCSQDVVDSCVTGLQSVGNTEWICTTCDSNLKKGKLPSCCKANKMSFPEKPEVLNLTPLEERLVSPRIPFMQIRELPRGGQLSIHGNIVNVPTDVNSTIRCLPRPIDESQTIPIKLKRRLSYKHHRQFQNVRPKRVLDAAKYLVETSDLFKREGFQVQDTWLDNVAWQCNEDWSEFVQNCDTSSEDMQTDQNVVKDIHDCPNSSSTSDIDNASNEKDDGDVSDGWCEVDERPSGVTDTLLQEPDVVENADKIISFAPGEGNKPLGLFMDKNSEYLSFPTIFCGKGRPDNNERTVPLSYSTVAKWELRCQDRRAAMCVPNIFYKLKKLQIKQIQDSACISLRKCKKKGKTYTAGDLKTEDSLNKIVHLDEGFRVLKNLRSSPAYVEKCKKDLFAMIRQLGNPTWFCSFSAAETRWTHLLKILGRIVHKKEYTDDEIKQMSWKEKSDLIQKDPVTCARNFHHMVQLFIREVLKSTAIPIGEIADYFYRVEFQQRGSPHIHSLFWIKDAPQYEKSPVDEIVKFVNKYITCQTLQMNWKILLTCKCTDMQKHVRK